MDALMERAVRSGGQYLARRGYEILDEGWKEPDGGEFGLVAKDEDGTLVFVDVSVSELEDGFVKSPRTRGEREISAAGWLCRNGEAVEDGAIRFDGIALMAIRFDDIALMAMGEGKAFLRHTMNSIGGEDAAS